jgi:hypothetical protein
MPLPSGLALPRDLERQTTMSTVWELHPKPQIMLEHVLEKEFWVHILQSRPIEAGHRVLVRAEDWSFCVELMFMEIDERRLWAKTFLLHRHWAPETGVIAEPAKFGEPIIGWGGPVHKWRIVMADGTIAEKGFQTREDAEEGLRVMQLEAAA